MEGRGITESFVNARRVNHFSNKDRRDSTNGYVTPSATKTKLLMFVTKNYETRIE